MNAQTSQAQSNDAIDEHSDSESESVDSLTRYLALAELGSEWLQNLTQLFWLELKRSYAAGKKVIALQLALIPLSIFFYVSTCISASYITYYLTQSPFFTVSVFMGIQVICISFIIFSINRLKKLIGFSQSRYQCKAMKDDFHQYFEQKNREHQPNDDTTAPSRL